MRIAALAFSTALLLVLAACGDDAEKIPDATVDQGTPDVTVDQGVDQLIQDTAPDVERDQGQDTLKLDVTQDTLKLDVTQDTVKVDTTCSIPSYPSDCSQVSYFQCGFGASCNGNVVTADWHEHVFCDDGPEQIVPYSCTYTCPNGCTNATTWPQNGADLVAAYCTP